MQARGCQSVSDSVNLNLLARHCALPAAGVLLALVLSACAPLSQSTEGAVATTGDAAVLTQGAGALVAKAAPPATAWDRMKDPAQGIEKHMYDLESPEVDQQGLASWYGPGFHGRKTANGERFNQYELTAAHPTYAFGTQLCVRSKSTGQAVVVRVNDRGPYAKNRVIDLSKAAAQELGMMSKGIKAVEIYKLEDGEEACPEALLQAQG